LPLTYLYEPNSAILKADAFKSISQVIKLSKLHQHSHLYTSIDYINFPRCRFKIIEVLLYNKNRIRKALGSKKANVTVRNYPETVYTIKRKFNIKDGGDLYVFFTTNSVEEKITIITNKCKSLIISDKALSDHDKITRRFIRDRGGIIYPDNAPL